MENDRIPPQLGHSMAGRPGLEVRLLINLAFFLCFFPSLIYFIAPNQTQPVAAMVAFPLLFLRPFRVTSVTLPVMALVGLIFVYIPISLAIYPGNVENILLHGGSYISPLILFLALQDRLQYLSPKPFLISLAVWFVVGLIQFFDFMEPLKGPLVEIGKILVADRFIATQYGGDTGRGVIFLASEPSMSAPTILLLGLTTVFFYREGKLSRWATTVSLTMVGIMVVLNASATLGVLVLATLIGWALHVLIVTRGRRRLALMGSLAIGSIAFIVVVFYVPTDVRLFLVVRSMIDYLLSGEGSGDIMTLLIQLGGQRALPWIMGFGSMLHNFGLGHGVASWTIDLVTDDVKAFLGINPFDYLEYLYTEILIEVQNKPQSFFAVIAFDFGVIGFAVLSWVVGAIVLYRRRLVGLDGSMRLIYLIPACTWLVGFGLMPLPAPWLLLMYSLHIARVRANVKHAVRRGPSDAAGRSRSVATAGI